MSDRQRDALVAGYLLGELNDADRARAEAALADDPAFADEVRRMRPVVTTLSQLSPEAWSPPAPPPLEPPPGAEQASAPRRRWSFVPARPLAAVLGAAALVAAGVGIGALAFDSGAEDPAGAQIALAPLDPQMPTARGDAIVDAARGRLRVNVDGLAPSDAGSHYELWVIREGSTRMVALGGFRVPQTGRATVDVDLPVSPRDYQLIDVSVEPDDGNPAHSGRSVLRARAA